MEPNQDNESPRVVWTDLPEALVGYIYTFLEWKDRVNLSLVCKEWKKGYGFPSLWKTFTFKLTDSQLAMTECPLTKFAERYGRMFRHVKIEYRATHFRKTWCIYFEEFLKTLMDRNPTLQSVEFLKLKDLFFVFFFFGRNATYGKVFGLIAAFLESQNELKKVNFLNCGFKFPDGVELLRKVVRKYGESLRYLGIRGIVCYDAGGQGPILEFTRNLPTICDLPNLTTLDIDYPWIFSSMFSPECFRTLRNRETPTLALSKISLLYDDELQTGALRPEISEYFRFLNPECWQHLRTLSPNLQVDLTIETHLLISEILRALITPHMPLTRLESKKGGLNSAFKLIDHLRTCNINDNLVSLHLGMSPTDADFVSPLNRVLPAFQELRFLEISIPFNSDIRNLLEHWRGNPLENLEKVVIHLSNIRDYGNYRTAQNKRSSYVSQLESINMNVEVVIDYEN